jgi:hypothetical protein
MSQRGDDAAFRYGAPAAVVDPILSFLYDLRRMEDTLLSALTHLGVDRRSLPPPFKDSQHDAEMTDNAEGIVSACSSGAAEDTTESSCPPLSSFDAYLRRGSTHGADPTPADAYEAVLQVLKWLDEQQQQEQQRRQESVPASTAISLPPSSPSKAQCLIAAFVAAGDVRDAFLVEAATEAEAHVQRPSKLRKMDREQSSSQGEGTLVGCDVQGANGATKRNTDACHILSLSAAEVRQAADVSRRYERLLRSCTAELNATIRAVTTSDLAASYSCHAKWVEVAAEDAKVKCVLPSSSVLQRNYEQLIRFNDALATCQAAVHSAYVALEEHVDVFVEEAQVVEKAERVFQECVVQARVESQGLREVRRRLKRTREALEKAAALNTQ